MTPRPGLFPAWSPWPATAYPSSTLRLNVLACDTPTCKAVERATTPRAYARAFGNITAPEAGPGTPSLFEQGFWVDHQLLAALGGAS